MNQLPLDKTPSGIARALTPDEAKKLCDLWDRGIHDATELKGFLNLPHSPKTIGNALNRFGRYSRKKNGRKYGAPTQGLTAPLRVVETPFGTINQLPQERESPFGASAAEAVDEIIKDAVEKHQTPRSPGYVEPDEDTNYPMLRDLYLQLAPTFATYYRNPYASKDIADMTFDLAVSLERRWRESCSGK